MWTIQCFSSKAFFQQSKIRKFLFGEVFSQVPFESFSVAAVNKHQNCYQNLGMYQKNTLCELQLYYHKTPQQTLSKEKKLDLSAEWNGIETKKNGGRGQGRVKVT